MTEIIKSYYAIIPANVRYDNDITSNAKLLYCEITALCNERGYCWAGNEYFAELYKVSERSISRWISDLIKKGYIVVEFQYKPGTKEIIKRYIKLASSSDEKLEQNCLKCVDKNVNTYRQNCHLGGDKNVRDNNIINNNIIINNNSLSEDEPSKDDPNKLKIDKYQRMVDLYSKICTKLSKVIKITNKRKTEIDKLLKLYSWEEIEDAFIKINSSMFCTGNNDRGWKADFDFCINTDKMANALEGKYQNSFDNKPKQQKPNNKFHNFDQKMAGMGESKLEEIMRMKRDRVH